VPGPALRNECLSEAEMSALIARTPITGRSLGDMTAHIGECDECRELMSALAQSSSLVKGKEEAFAATEYAPTTEPKRVRSLSLPASLTGSLIGGKYRAGPVIGTGGMGTVLEVTHEGLGQKFAMKLLHGDAARSDEARSRFLREARSAAQLKGEHVVRVTDTGVLQDSNDPYFVMELLAGRSLLNVLRDNGPVAPKTCALYILEACEALAEAHALGIVHRDLKPDNLFLATRADGTAFVKVVDFGISKHDSEGAMSLTSQNVIMGTPRYMAPEQMRNAKDVDARADLWALGAIMYELLSGKPPFDAPSITELITKVQLEPHAPLATLMPNLPKALAAAVENCLTKDRSARTQDVRQLARALVPFAQGAAAVHVERIERLLGATPPLAAPPKPKRSHRLPLGIALAALIGGLGAWRAVQSSSTPNVASASVSAPTSLPALSATPTLRFTSDPLPTALPSLSVNPIPTSPQNATAVVRRPAAKYVEPSMAAAATASRPPAPVPSAVPSDPNGLRSRH
jgi:eukaryotic-like serine/threonine-protein kinase